MPLETEIGLLCQEFNATPGVFGFDDHDPRFIRRVRMCMAVQKAVQSRNSASNKAEWNRKNPESVHFLRWARGGESEAPHDPTEVKITLPERPARRRG